MRKQDLVAYYDSVADGRDRWVSGLAAAYHGDLRDFHRFLIPPGKRVVDVGCGTGDLLHAVAPSHGVGLDASARMVEVARKKHPHLHFAVDDLESLRTEGPFDYVVLSNLIGLLGDVQDAFRQMRRLTTPDSRVVITYYSRLWQPVLAAAEAMGLKMRQPPQNWLSPADVANLLYLNDYEVLKQGARMLCPVSIPGVSWFLNKVLAHFPGVRHLCLTVYIVARERPARRPDPSVSVIIPTKNEAGNIPGAIERTPDMGTHTEFIFVDGHSTDGTVEEIRDVQRKRPDKDIKFMTQTGSGKANAVFEGMDAASGEVLVILDSDLTVPPEELPKFYDAFVSGHGDFVNGCRLVYGTEKGAMRFLNMVANHAFALAFTWLLGFRIKDTLCGTKLVSAKHYRDLRASMRCFGDFDPFGDFVLIFGAAKLNLKVVDVPVHYRARTYGDIKIRRFRHGVLLARMVLFAVRKLKFV